MSVLVAVVLAWTAVSLAIGAAWAWANWPRHRAAAPAGPWAVQRAVAVPGPRAAVREESQDPARA